MAKKQPDTGTVTVDLNGTVGYTDPVTKRQQWYGPGKGVEVPARLARALGHSTKGGKARAAKTAKAKSNAATAKTSSAKSDSDASSAKSDSSNTKS